MKRVVVMETSYDAYNCLFTAICFFFLGMKLPDNTMRFQNIGDSDTCGSYCSNNCSCNAYAFVQTVGCMLWSGDLIDLYKFDEGGYDLFVKVPASLLGKSS
jgi:PAN-like domain